MKKVRILCLSGSLRKASFNSAVIQAIKELSPAEIEINIFSQMDAIPLFNPDRESENIPVIAQLQEAVKNADGMLIASPEYAHGITGVLKNALDWLVSGEDFPDMPVALINTSPRASHAQVALREVIKTMSGIVIESASVTIPLLGTPLDREGIVHYPEISHTLLQAMHSFREAIIE